MIVGAGRQEKGAGTVVSAESLIDRRQRILDFVSKTGVANTADLISLTGRSAMTVHRDVEFLTNQGLLRKFHGGVSAATTTVFDAGTSVRSLEHVPEKASIARVARSMVEPGNSVLLDNSSTSVAIAAELVSIPDLTIVTNFPKIVDIFAHEGEARIFVIGGEYSYRHEAMYGPPQFTGLDTFSTDVSFTSASAFDTVSTYQQDIASVEIKIAMVALAKRAVLAVDSSKFGRTSLRKCVAVKAFADVIVTEGIPKAAADAIRDVSTLHIARVNPAK